MTKTDEKLKCLLQEYTCKDGALLEALHAIQHEYGYIHSDTVPVIAHAFNISHADVHGVISFYHDLREKPAGKHVIKVCQAESCQSMGSRGLTKHIEKALATEMNSTSASGSYTLEPVYCLGNCACSPSVMINDTVYGKVSDDRFDTILEDEVSS